MARSARGFESLRYLVPKFMLRFLRHGFATSGWRFEYDASRASYRLIARWNQPRDSKMSSLRHSQMNFRDSILWQHRLRRPLRSPENPGVTWHPASRFQSHSVPFSAPRSLCARRPRPPRSQDAACVCALYTDRGRKLTGKQKFALHIKSCAAYKPLGINGLDGMAL